MILTTEQIKKEDEKTRKETLQTISDITTNFFTIRDSIYNLEDSFNLESQIPIPSITLNNKIVELSNMFRSKGIFLFNKKSNVFTSEDGSIPSIIQSSIAEIVISVLIDMVTECLTILEAYHERLSRYKKESTNKHKLSIAIANLFPGFTEKRFELDYEEELVLSKMLEYYKKIDDQIFTYNLRDNLIPSILIKIQEENIDATEIALLVEDDIIPDLEALGLSDLIPKLKTRLTQYYQEQLPKGYEPKEEEKYLYIPDFERAKEIRDMLAETIDTKQSIEASKPISTDTSTIIIEKDDNQPPPNPKIKQRKPETKQYNIN